MIRMNSPGDPVSFNSWCRQVPVSFRLDLLVFRLARCGGKPKYVSLRQHFKVLLALLTVQICFTSPLSIGEAPAKHSVQTGRIP